MLDTVVGILGLAAPTSPLALPANSVLRAGDDCEKRYYYGSPGATVIPYVAWFEDALIFLPKQDGPTITVLDQIEAVLQLSVNAAIGSANVLSLVSRR